MATYHLSLLGAPLITGPDGPVQLRLVKAQALLAYLATRPGVPCARSFLAGMLWEEQREAEGLQNLSLALHRLRQALPWFAVEAGRESVTWPGSPAVQVDTVRFQELVERGDAASLAAAVALRRGPFLEGFEVPGSTGFAEWLQTERQHWDLLVLDVLERLIGQAEATGQWQQAVGYARKALQIDPLQERFHRHLMQAHHGAGERAAALAAYAACRDVLFAELGVEPDAATRALYDRIVAAGTDGSRSMADATPLVGREAELAQAEEALAAAHRNQGRVLLVQGEAGIGKTRLLNELLARQRQAGKGTQLLGRCHEDLQCLPFAPLTHALRQAFPHLDPARLPLAPVWLQEVARLVPDLLPQQVPAPAPVGELDRQRLLEGVAQFLAILPRPVTLCIEDLHWADASTLLLLGYLARHPATPGLALVVTSRSGEEPASARHLYAELERDGRLWRLEVGALSPAAVDQLVTAAGGAPNPALSRRLYAETGGHALYTVELLRALRTDGAGGDPAALATLPMPRTVQAVIEQRLDRLAPAARLIVTAAAIFPRGAASPLVAEVAGLDGSSARAALAAALDAGILDREEDGAQAGAAAAPVVRFAHDMVRRVVRAALPPPRAVQLHRLAFAGLQARDGATPNLAEELAYHATAGELWAEAARWHQEAARAAEQVFAYPEAAGFLEQALACLAHLPPTPDRRQRELDIRLRLSQMGNYFDPRRLAGWVAPVTRGASALGDEERLSAGLLAQSEALTIKGRLHRALLLLDTLVPMARIARSKALLARTLAIQGCALAIRGEYARSIQLLEEALSLLDAASSRGMLAFGARLTLPIVRATTGDFDRSVAEARALLDECRDRGDPVLIGHALGNLGGILCFRGEWAEAVQCSREGTAQARRTGHRLMEHTCNTYAGLALARLGDLEGGLRAQQEGIAITQRAGTSIMLDRMHIWLGEIHLLRGDPSAAAAAVAMGRKIAERNGYLYGVPLADRVQGQIAAHLGRHAEARQRLTTALTGFHALGARPEVARCHALLAPLAQTEAERLEHRRRAEEMFLSMGMAWDHAQLVAHR